MLDINLFRVDKGGDPELVRESQRRRYAPVEQVDKVIELDNLWRAARFDLDGLNKEFNATNKQVAAIKVAARKGEAKEEDANALLEKSAQIKAAIADAEAKEKELAATRDKALGPIGNLVHDSVPISDDEDNNVTERTFGTPREALPGEKLYNHVDLCLLAELSDLEAGSAVAGGRGYYLMGVMPLLNQALINYALQFLYKRDYKPVHTPFFMRKEIMADCAQLEQFDEELYKVTGEGDDKYLIATSEQTLCSLNRGKWIESAALPQKMAGYSTCFRKEVGSHGRDTLGIFRVHQFEKVEQFCMTTPDGNDSWEMMEHMLANSEAFYQSLDIPYRVVNIVSGELNNAAAKKYDVEAWFPASKTFRELVSCSNCTDYQSRRLETRLRSGKGATDQDKKYVHLLNSTLTATERTLCCLIENYQTPTGIRIPEALQPFMMDIDFIPFTKAFDKKGKLIDLPVGPGKGIKGVVDNTLFIAEGSPSAVALKAIATEVGFSGQVVVVPEGEALPQAVLDAGALSSVPPALVSGGVVMTQPATIARFLATTASKCSLYPDQKKAAEVSRVEQLLEWYSGSAAGALAAGGDAMKACLAQLESFSLSGDKFLTGKAMTVADVLIVAAVEAAGGAGSAKGFDKVAAAVKDSKGYKGAAGAAPAVKGGKKEKAPAPAKDKAHEAPKAGQFSQGVSAVPTGKEPGSAGTGKLKLKVEVSQCNIKKIDMKAYGIEKPVCQAFVKLNDQVFATSADYGLDPVWEASTEFGLNDPKTDKVSAVLYCQGMQIGDECTFLLDKLIKGKVGCIT